MTTPVSDLQEISPSSIIELFKLELNAEQHGVNETYYFHAGTSLNENGEVVWAGHNYLRFPLAAEGFAYSGKGSLPRPVIRVANVMGTITALLLTLPNGLAGAKITRIRTLARYLDDANFPSGNPWLPGGDSTAAFPEEVYFIDRKASETRDVVEFELAAAFDLAGVRLPKRQCISSICQWEYRSPECGYTGTNYFNENDIAVSSAQYDVCGKRLTSCEARFGVFTRTGSVTSGSNVLTLTSTLGIQAGDPVRGFGIPANTTITAILSSTTAQLSSNATATTTITRTGTPSSTASTMTVSSSSGLSIGMTVTGSYTNTATITAISGTTLTLSSRPYSFSRTGTYDRVSGNDYINLSDTSGITTGMRVFGSVGINTTVSSVTTNVRIRLTNEPDQLPEQGVSVLLYFMPASPGSSSYTFSANPTYSFRSPDFVLPFGSFPGVGAFFS